MVECDMKMGSSDSQNMEHEKLLVVQSILAKDNSTDEIYLCIFIYLVSDNRKIMLYR